MISQDYIIKDLDCANSAEAIEALGHLLYEGGAVKDTFIGAVLEREKVYPTGLPAAAFDIAIPHTDSVHVNSPAIAVGVLKKPVEFMQMGSTDIILNAELMIMLAIDDPHEQLSLLTKLMSLFQNETLLKEIKNADSEQSIYEILNNNI